MRRTPILTLLLLTLAISVSARAQTTTTWDIIDRQPRGDYRGAPNSVYEPWLIPVDLLKLPYDTWSQAERQRISKSIYNEFHAKVAKVTASGRSGKCAYSSISLFKGGPPEHPGLLALAAGAVPEVVMGKVERVVPVWDQVMDRVSSLVYLRVVESLKGTIPVGTLIKYRRPNGLVKIGRIILCSRLSEQGKTSRTDGTDDVTWLTDQQSHQDYLIVGNLSPVNKWFLETAAPHEFKVIGGTAFDDGEPIGLNEIYQQLAH